MLSFDLALDEAKEQASLPLGPARVRPARWPSSFGLAAYISLKQAGDMGKSAEPENPNRLRYLRSLGVADPGKVYSCRQMHSRTVLVAGEATRGRAADGLITDRRDAILAVTVADCLPIFLVDPVHQAFGLLHSGWKGTGIVAEALERLEREYGSNPADLSVTIGPGIGSCCYQVEQERYTDFRSRFGEGSVRRQGERLFLDLRAANILLLERLGVRDILCCASCTACTQQLASYRRDRLAFQHMLACIGIPGGRACTR